MGFFSWKTQDTHRSIPNVCSNRATFTVIMADDKGNKWTEDGYEGYGIFGGKDYYELLDEMNGGTGDRDTGINKAFEHIPLGKPHYNFPSLSERGTYYDGIEPEYCNYQGYFYDGADDDEENENESFL